MTTFNDREQGFERKFALDQEQEFKAQARRNRMLGEWAAGLMGLGWWYGSNWVALLDYVDDVFTGLTALTVAVVLAVLLLRLLRTQSST